MPATQQSSDLESMNMNVLITNTQFKNNTKEEIFTDKGKVVHPMNLCGLPIPVENPRWVSFTNNQMPWLSFPCDMNGETKNYSRKILNWRTMLMEVDIYLDNNRSNSLINTEICPGLTSILLGKLPHDFNGLVCWFRCHNTKFLVYINIHTPRSKTKTLSICRNGMHRMKWQIKNPNSSWKCFNYSLPSSILLTKALTFHFSLHIHNHR